MFATLRNNTFGLSGPCNWRLSPTSSSGSWAQFQVGSTRGCPVAHYPPTAVTESSPHHAQCPVSNHSAKESTRPPNQTTNSMLARLHIGENWELWKAFHCTGSLTVLTLTEASQVQCWLLINDASPSSLTILLFADIAKNYQYLKY